MVFPRVAQAGLLGLKGLIPEVKTSVGSCDTKSKACRSMLKFSAILMACSIVMSEIMAMKKFLSGIFILRLMYAEPSTKSLFAGSGFAYT